MLGILALIVGSVALATTLTRKVGADQPQPIARFIPTTQEIASAQSLAELDVYYNLIGELYIVGEITLAEYSTLYSAYYDKWNELVGAVP